MSWHWGKLAPVPYLFPINKFKIQHSFSQLSVKVNCSAGFHFPWLFISNNKIQYYHNKIFFVHSFQKYCAQLTTLKYLFRFQNLSFWLVENNIEEYSSQAFFFLLVHFFYFLYWIRQCHLNPAEKQGLLKKRSIRTLHCLKMSPL